MQRGDETGAIPSPARCVMEALERRCLLSASAAAGFHVSLVTGGMAAPTAEEITPDGRIFVADQGGSVRVVQNGHLLAQPFVSLNVDDEAERGLVGIALDPRFQTNHYVYLYYTVKGNAAQHIAPHNRVSRFTANGNVALAGSEKVLLDLGPLDGLTDHDAGSLHFGTDGKLYISVGDSGNGSEAQSLASLMGKMLRLNSDGTIPSDNPFFKVATGKNRAIWALGLRNPFTFAVQPGTGRVFINDVGENTQEEIDDGKAGANYGWSSTSGPFAQSKYPKFAEPFFSYNNGAGATWGLTIAGGAFYSPTVNQFPSAYRNQYLFADYVKGWVKVLGTGNRSVSTLATGFTNLVDIDVAANGVVYVLEHATGPAGSAGAIYQIRYG